MQFGILFLIVFGLTTLLLNAIVAPLLGIFTAVSFLSALAGLALFCLGLGIHLEIK